MKYRSTRGGVEGATFEEALFSGYAPDGGLYVPERLPEIPEELLSQWKKTPPSYPQVVFEIVKLFVSEEELPRDVLEKSIQLAYASFDTDRVIELHECKSSSPGTEYTVVEMYHGKTRSFKDYAMSLVGRLLEYFVQKRNNHITILVGTSGDTGSAAIEAVKGLNGIDIIVLFPKGKISEVQELQMVTVMEENVTVFEVEGTSDDLDVPIKESFPQPGLTSINSVNCARIMIQVAHYIYLCTLEQWKPVDIYIPTGGAGNLSAGLVASLLGIPVNLYATQNANDNVETLINKGELVMGGPVMETYANAMDIRFPYNVERILYLASDVETVAKVMKNATASEGEAVRIPQDVYEKITQRIKGAMKVDAERILETIKDCWNANNYLICPHTATAVTCLLANSKKTASRNKSFVISTASPEKFPDAAKAANIDSLGDSGLLRELRARQRQQPKLMRKGDNWRNILQAEINRVSAAGK